MSPARGYFAFVVFPLDFTSELDTGFGPTPVLIIILIFYYFYFVKLTVECFIRALHDNPPR